MNDVRCVYWKFVVASTKASVWAEYFATSSETAAAAHVRSMCISVVRTRCFGNGTVLQIRCQISDVINFRFFALAFVDNYFAHTIHFTPVPLVSFWITDKDLIAVFECVAEYLKHSLIKLVEAVPGL